MSHSRGKRKREQDCDFVDLTGETPVYKKSTPTATKQSQHSGPSSNTDTTFHQPRARKQKKKDPKGPPPEKRAAQFKHSCPQKILERVDRVMSQRFFMIDRQRKDGELREEFSVLGSTGNVYTVIVGQKPSCNCPDAQRGNHCKHILFVFLKVLQVPQDSAHWYQKALLFPELESIFANAPLAPNSTAHERVREAYARATGKPISSTSKSQSTKTDETAAKNRRIPGQEDDCPICYECMHGEDSKSLVWCETCNNAVHAECFQQWAISAGSKLTCVFCRAPWIEAFAAGQSKKGKPSVFSEGYINLGQIAGLSPVRDDSSYYHGYGHGY